MVDQQQPLGSRLGLARWWALGHSPGAAEELTLQGQDQYTRGEQEADRESSRQV